MDKCFDFGVQMKKINLKKQAQKVEEYLQCVAYWICIYAPTRAPLAKLISALNSECDADGIPAACSLYILVPLLPKRINVVFDKGFYCSGSQTFSRQGPLNWHELDHGPPSD